VNVRIRDSAITTQCPGGSHRNPQCAERTIFFFFLNSPWDFWDRTDDDAVDCLHKHWGGGSSL